MRHTPELELDHALEWGRPVEDSTVADLSDLASRVQHWLAAEPPPARQQRALFAAAVGAHRPRPLRALVPAVAAAALLATLGWLGSNALPGDTLYPVREVLERVGLAGSALEEIDERIGAATAKVESAESALDDRPALAERLARDAISDLNDARRLLGEIGEQTGPRAALIAGLELRAARVIERALDALGTGDLPGAEGENSGGVDEGRRRDSESDEADADDDDGPDGGTDSGDDGPDANEDDAEDDAKEGPGQDDATSDGKDDGGTGSDPDGDDPDELEAGDANGNDNDTGDGNDPGDGNDAEDIDPSDADVAEPDEADAD